MAPDDWCEQWTAKKDASGWRSDWPSRAKIEGTLEKHEDGLNIENLSAKIGHEDTVTLYAALAHLRLNGFTSRRGLKWFWNSEPEPTPTPPAPVMRRTYTDQEFVAQFPFGEKAALPLPVIRKRVCSNLGISEAKFSDERFNQLTAGTIQKITLPSGEDRYFR